MMMSDERRVIECAQRAYGEGGRFAAQEHALVCRGAMRDARGVLVVALDIQTFVK